MSPPGLVPSLFREGSVTHWGRETHICVGKLTIIASDTGLSPGRRQAIIWTNAWILLIGPLGTNFSENLFEILRFSFTKMRLKVSFAKWRRFCLGLNVLTHRNLSIWITSGPQWVYPKTFSEINESVGQMSNKLRILDTTAAVYFQLTM